MTLVILYRIPPQDLNSWLWMALGGFERIEFSYFRLVWDIYEGFRQTTGSFSTMLLMRGKYQNKSNHFLILREISNTLWLCKPHIHVQCACILPRIPHWRPGRLHTCLGRQGDKFHWLVLKNKQFLLAMEFTVFKFSFLPFHLIPCIPWGA